MSLSEGRKLCWLAGPRVTLKEYKAISSQSKAKEYGTAAYLMDCVEKAHEHFLKNKKVLDIADAPENRGYDILSRRLPAIRCTIAERAFVNFMAEKNAITVSQVLVALHYRYGR